jgi:TPR repeat protein
LACSFVLLAAMTAPSGVLAAAVDDHQRGMQAFGRGDMVVAMREFRRGADAGHGPSQAMLAYILDRADYAEEAARLYRAAADSGNAQGHDGLGTAYLIGRGVPRNEKLAWVHFSKAAELGHAAAIEKVADAYRTGTLGRDPDAPSDAARRALVRAAERDHLPSIEALVQAYRDGGSFGIAADKAQADQWFSRGEALRKLRSAAAAGSAAAQ